MLESNLPSRRRRYRGYPRFAFLDSAVSPLHVATMKSSLLNLSAQQHRRAASVKDKIAKLEKTLAKILGETPSSLLNGGARRKSKMSAAGRARVAAAQRARWAKFKASKKK